MTPRALVRGAKCLLVIAVLSVVVILVKSGKESARSTEYGNPVEVITEEPTPLQLQKDLHNRVPIDAQELTGPQWETGVAPSHKGQLVLRGTVLDVVSGRPVEEVSLMVSSGQEKWHVHTDEVGRFRIDNFRPAEFLRIQCSEAERAIHPRAIELHGGELPLDLTFLLDPPAREILVAVVDSVGRAVHGAMITAVLKPRDLLECGDPPLGRPLRTDYRGLVVLHIPWCSGDWYTGTVFAIDEQGRHGTSPISSGNTADFMEVVLEDQNSLVVRTVDASGEPVARVWVEIDSILEGGWQNKIGLTDGLGLFVFRGVPEGEYIVKAISGGGRRAGDARVQRYGRGNRVDRSALGR